MRTHCTWGGAFVSALCLIIFIGWSFPPEKEAPIRLISIEKNSRRELPRSDPKRGIADSPNSNGGLFGSLKLVGSGDEKIDLSLHGSTLEIHINSTRSRCGMNETGGPSEACVFRAYATSDSFRSGGYCHAVKFSNGSYQCSLGVIENRFHLLLLFESFVNNSNFGLLDNPGWGAVVFNDTHESMGKALLEQEVQIGPERVLIPLPKPQKLCSYREANINGNDFIWISKKVVEAAGLTVADAIIALTEKERMPLKQDYVWFPRGCRQPWISQKDLEAAGKAMGGIDVAFVGASRLRDTYDAFLSIYPSKSADFQLLFAGLPVWVPHSVFPEMARIVNEDPWPTMCPRTNTTNPRLLVLLISDGIWAARGHENFGPITKLGIFRHYENLLARLDFILDACRFRRVKVVFATQPQIHSWDCRTNSNNTMFPKGLGLLGPRIEVVNWASRKIAREHGLLLVDLGGATDARNDATCDNRHYDDPNRANVSLGVSLTMSQLALAAALESASD